MSILQAVEQTLATRLADRWAVVDVERCEHTTGPDGTRWYDTRYLFDEREHPIEHVHWHRESVTWLILRGLLKTHPKHPHLVRLLPQAPREPINPQPRS